jgi:hypothetical protein
VNVDTGQIEAIGRHYADMGAIVVGMLTELAPDDAPKSASGWRNSATGNQPATTPGRSGHGGRHAAPGWPLRLIQGGRP